MRRSVVCFAIILATTTESFVLSPTFSPSTSRRSIKYELLEKKQAHTVSWEERYSELEEFYTHHGHSNVMPSASNHNSNDSLAYWVSRNRRQASSLDPERVQKLNELDFVWSMVDYQWQIRFQELLDYRDEFGDFNVPVKYKTLGQWALKQRRQYKKQTLPQNRLEQMQSIGFIWDIREWQFQTNLEKLRQFKETHGHLNVTFHEEGGIGPWYYSQRKQYVQYLKSNGDKTSSVFTPSRRKALEEIGFGPHLLENRQRDCYGTPITTNLTATTANPKQRVTASWEDRYSQLRQYYKANGHSRVPSSNKPLGVWVNAQRQAHAKGTLKLDRRKLLDKVEFVYNTYDWKWMKRFTELEQYYKQHGHTNVPKSAGVLGEWVECQRVQYAYYQKGKSRQITHKRVALLATVKFDWKRGKTRQIEHDLAWHRNLLQLKAFRKEHGHFQVPRFYKGGLGAWTATQRSHCRALLRGEKLVGLSEERIEAFANCGFFNDCYTGDDAFYDGLNALGEADFMSPDDE